MVCFGKAPKKSYSFWSLAYSRIGMANSQIEATLFFVVYIKRWNRKKFFLLFYAFDSNVCVFNMLTV